MKPFTINEEIGLMDSKKTWESLFLSARSFLPNHFVVVLPNVSSISRSVGFNLLTHGMFDA
jgi:hypothetical protein